MRYELRDLNLSRLLMPIITTFVNFIEKIWVNIFKCEDFKRVCIHNFPIENLKFQRVLATTEGLYAPLGLKFELRGAILQ